MDEVTIGNARILHGDCLEFMRELPDKFYELACVDVPYGIGESGDHESRNRVASNKYVPKEWDTNPPTDEYFSELQRVSKNQIIFGANHFIDKIAKPSPCWIVWDKVTGNSDFADSELAYTSFKTAVRNFRFQWSGMLQGDMKNKEKRIHQCQKPVKLYEWILTNYAKQGDKILDTHGGSMSSVIAALNLGFEITCLELDSDYYAAGVARVRQSQQQSRMFEPEIVMPKQDTLL